MKKSFVMLMSACAVVFASCEKSSDLVTPQGLEAEMEANASGNAARKSYTLNAETSVVEWWGHSPSVSHHGSFAVTGENIEVVNGKVKSGRFVIPIASIQNFDLPTEIKPILLNHLKSADFFDMALYPEATFEFKKMIPLTKVMPGAVTGANYLVSGDFTMIGKTHELTFPAHVTEVDGQLKMEAKLKIDRTRWGMTYGADPAYGDHQIFPTVDLHLKLNGVIQ